MKQVYEPNVKLIWVSHLMSGDHLYLMIGMTPKQSLEVNVYHHGIKFVLLLITDIERCCLRLIRIPRG